MIPEPTAAEDLGAVSAHRLDRLDGLYGLVEAAQARRLMAEIEGPAIDIGCGVGAWLPRLVASGFRVVGVDLDEPSLVAGARLAPAPRVRARAESLPFRKGSCRTVVFRESAHHVSLAPILRSLRDLGVAKLIFFEPNDGAILRLAHAVIGHKDPHLSAAELEKMLRDEGWRVEKRVFSDLFALPLSGGWIAPWKIPRAGRAGILLVAADRALGAMLPLRILRNLSFRYMITAIRDDAV